jgi:hypothetical protein
MSSSNNPVDLGPFPARRRYRFRLIPMQRSHHRDMRHHWIAFGAGISIQPFQKMVDSRNPV